MQLQDALGQFQVQIRADGRSQHTRNQYQRHVAGMIAWLVGTGRPTAIEDITPGIVAEFFASDAARNSARGGRKKATSANAQRTSIRCFFRWAHESGHVAANSARLLRRARCCPPPPKALHADERERLRAVLANAKGNEGARDCMLVALLLGTGVRIGSALALDVGDVDLAHRELTLRSAKNDRPCTAILPASVVKKLRVFIGKRTSGPLFLAGDRRISTRHAQRRLAHWLAAAEIVGRSAHSLRHSFAMRIYTSTGDIQLTQLALGHASIISTVTYAKVDQARLRAAIGT